MFNTIANLLGYVLNFIYNIVQNYGVAIILFSILLRLLFLPITIKQQKSMKKSSKIQEEVKKLQVKYANDQEALNRETMELYRREHFSPFSGCLSTIIQFLIFISVFYLVSRPLTYMKKVDASTLKEYTNRINEIAATETSEENSNELANEAIENIVEENVIEENVVVEETQNTETNQTAQVTRSAYNEIKIIELFGKDDPSININMDFLGLDLSKVPTQNMADTKVFIIPFLYVLLTFVNIKMTTKLTETAESNKKKEEEKLKEEEEKAKKIADKAKKKEFERELKKADKDAKAMIKTEVTEELEKQDDMPDVTGMTKGMNYLMPLLSISIALVAPLGLSLYWLVSILLQLLERIAINAASKINEKEA